MSTAQNLASLSQVFTNGPLGNRNRIINGCFRVSQKGSTTVTAGTAVYAAADRWYVGATGATVGTANDWVGPNSPSALRVSGAASNTNVYMGQRIESINIADLAGDAVTVSGYFWCPTGVVPKLNVYYPSALNNFTTSTQYINSAPMGASVLTAGWTYLSYTFTLPSQATSGIAIEFVMGPVLAGANAAISGITLEPGTVATPFELKNYSTELLQCQRYYTISSFRLDIPTSTATSFGSVTINFPVAMRVVPTSSIASPIYGGSASGSTFNSFQGGSVWGIAPTYAAQSTWGSVSANVTASAEI